MAGLVLRGVLTGLVAGLGAGLFLLVVGEPLIEVALTYEAHSAGSEVVSRETQRLGLLLATGLFGVGVGGLFAVGVLLIGPRLRTGTAFERSVRLAGAAFLTLWLVPFLKYPSNPPAVGDPATAQERTNVYLAMVGISVLLAVLTYLAARWLEDRRIAAHIRLPIVIVAYVVALAVVFNLLPDNPDPITVPAALIWDFRLASAGGQALLWALLGTGFGLVFQRWLETGRGRQLPAFGR